MILHVFKAFMSRCTLLHPKSLAYQPTSEGCIPPDRTVQSGVDNRRRVDALGPAAAPSSWCFQGQSHQDASTCRPEPRRLEQVFAKAVGSLPLLITRLAAD